MLFRSNIWMIPPVLAGLFALTKAKAVFRIAPGPVPARFNVKIPGCTVARRISSGTVNTFPARNTKDIVLAGGSSNGIWALIWLLPLK